MLMLQLKNRSRLWLGSLYYLWRYTNVLLPTTCTFNSIIRNVQYSQFSTLYEPLTLCLVTSKRQRYSCSCPLTISDIELLND